MSKTAQTMNLSKWFGIDRVLFGERSPKEALGESGYPAYVIAKGALLSNLFEIYTALGYNPELELASTRQMVEFASQGAELALGHARNVLTHEDVSKQLNSEIESVVEGVDDLRKEAISEELVDRNIKATALDIYLMEDAIENGDTSKLSGSDGKIMVSAFKKLRDALISYTRI